MTENKNRVIYITSGFKGAEGYYSSRHFWTCVGKNKATWMTDRECNEIVSKLKKLGYCVRIEDK
jgi:hypothetical protein